MQTMMGVGIRSGHSPLEEPPCPIPPLRKMEDENRKRPGYDNDGDFGGKRPWIPANSDDGDDLMAWLSMDDEAVSELSKLLEAEIDSPVIKVKFIADPYSPPLIFQSSPSSYVTINGNEESCGSSFSDSDSSVMASVDMSGTTKRVSGGFGWFTGWSPAAEGGALVSDAEEEEVAVRPWMEADGGTKGCDEYDDDMLAKFLGEDLFESQ